MRATTFRLRINHSQPESSPNSNANLNVEFLVRDRINCKQIDLLAAFEHDVGHREAALDKLHVTLDDVDFGLQIQEAPMHHWLSINQIKFTVKYHSRGSNVPKQYVNVKIPVELADEVDKVLEKKLLGYRSRAEFVAEAVRDKLIQVRK